MKTFEKFTKEIDESDIILSEARRYFGILIEKDSEQYKQYKKNRAKFQKTFGKNIKPTVVQPGLDLYKAGGPFIPDKTTYKDTGKKVPRMEPKPQFGKPKPVKKTKGAPDRSLVKKAISDIRASDRRLYDTGAKPKTSFSRPQQKKIELDIIKKNLSQQRRRQLAYDAFDDSDAGRPSTGNTVNNTKPRTVKQSEVSKKAQDFTTKVDAEKKIKDAIVKKSSKSNISKKTFKDFEKQATSVRDKLRKDADAIQKNPNLTGKEKASKARNVMRDVKSADKLSKRYNLASKGFGTPGVTPISKAKDLAAVTNVGGSARVTVNKTRGAKSGPRSVSNPPTSRFRKIVDKVRTSKIGSKVIKGLSKSRYGKIAGVALGVAGAAAGISALNRPKSGKGTKLDFSKDIVGGPSIRNLVKNDKGKLVAGKPKRFQLGQKVTMNDLKNTTFTKKLTDKQLAKAKTNNKNT